MIRPTHAKLNVFELVGVMYPSFAIGAFVYLEWFVTSQAVQGLHGLLQISSEILMASSQVLLCSSYGKSTHLNELLLCWLPES